MHPCVHSCLQQLSRKVTLNLAPPVLWTAIHRCRFLWAWSKQQTPSHVISFPRIHLLRNVKKVEKMLLVHNSTSFDHKLCTRTWISERKHSGSHVTTHKCGIRKSRFLHRLLFCTETRVERSPEATSANYAFSDLDSQPCYTENTSVFPLHSALPPYHLKFPLDLLWKHLMTISSQTWKWHQPCWKT